MNSLDYQNSSEQNSSSIGTACKIQWYSAYYSCKRLNTPSQGAEKSTDAGNQTKVQVGNLYPSGQNSLASRGATDFQLRELRFLDMLTGKH